MDERPRSGLIGARSIVGKSLLPLLTKNDGTVVAFSRKPSAEKTAAVICRQLNIPALPESIQIENWLCAAPIWVLPEHFSLLESYGIRRIVALSSTSRFSKTDSSDSAESMVAQRLTEGEEQLKSWAGSKGVEWVILRPTLIYGRGQDKNIAEIARFVRRFGFFPLLGKAMGMRQPIHADDVAQACIAALNTPAATNRTYNISGGETLPYREMVSRVFIALNRRPRLVTIPLPTFRVAVACLRLRPRYRHWSAAMAERMNHDLMFDHSEAARDLGFSPRPFILSPEDVATST